MVKLQWRFAVNNRVFCERGSAKMGSIKRKSKSIGLRVVIIALGVAINLGLYAIAKRLGIGLYLDSIGTILTAMFGGLLPAVFVGFITNAIGIALSPVKVYFGIINVMVAVLASSFAKRNVFKKVYKTVLAAVVIALTCTLLSSLITWFIYGFDFGDVIPSAFAQKLYDSGSYGKFLSLLVSNLYVEGIDKVISVGVAAIVYRFLPALPFGGTGYTYSRDYNRLSLKKKGISLTAKTATVIIAAEILLGAVTAGVSYYTYREISVRNYTEKCRGVSEVAAAYIDGDKVGEYFATNGESAGYKETKNLLYALRDSFEQIEYVYCYQIKEDGCHVLFDLDTEDVEASKINSVIEFDESFKVYLDDLLAGKPIDPIITDDTYGWLLTVYTPVYDSDGNCVCYAAADIEMDRVITDEITFIAKVLSLFLSVSVLILAVVIEVMNHDIITPINKMARAAGNLVFDDGKGQKESLAFLRDLGIKSEDEVGDLYRSLDKMATDTAEHIKEVKHQANVISQMQEAIIMDFAEMVEARDKCTGDHIKKTSYYVGEIAEELRREGKFADVLTDDYIEHLKRSAPLHDVGKINVSDVILNKPGKLTDEEFEIMKTHTTAGESILKNSTAFAQSEGYLKEAVYMAAYHHERWDGRGYPYGLSGEDIPLCARIMAVADVFDALVSKRGYKEPFSFEKATGIIREEAGTHFDPDVAAAFLNIAERFKDKL